MKRFGMMAVGMMMLVAGGCVKEKEPAVVAAVSPETAEVPAAAPQAGAIAWTQNLQAGLAQAAQEKKPVMVDFYADWCGWCKKLDKDVYTNPAVIDLARAFVCVKVDTDKEKQDAEKYKVQGLPTIVFLGPDGKVIETFVGYRDAAAFKGVMTEIMKNAAQ